MPSLKAHILARLIELHAQAKRERLRVFMERDQRHVKKYGCPYVFSVHLRGPGRRRFDFTSTRELFLPQAIRAAISEYHKRYPDGSFPDSCAGVEVILPWKTCVSIHLNFWKKLFASVRGPQKNWELVAINISRGPSRQGCWGAL